MRRSSHTWHPSDHVASRVTWPAGWPIGTSLCVVALIVLRRMLCASETALLSINRYRLRNLVRLGNRSARQTELLLAADRSPRRHHPVLQDSGEHHCGCI